MNFTIEPGRIVGLLGPNGSGKSTFIKLATGLLTPTTGTITICDLPVSVETKRRVSYLPDKNYLNDGLRINQILDYFHDFYDNFDLNKAYEMLKRLNIDPKSRLKNAIQRNEGKGSADSGHEPKRDLYLLDEPIGGVDRQPETIFKYHIIELQ